MHVDIILSSYLENSADYSCNGVIINSKFILTALHCVVEDPTELIADLKTKTFSHVLLGATNLRKRRKNKRKRRTGLKMYASLYFLIIISYSYHRKIANITLHREGADLALVEVSGEININIFTPICLPERGMI